MKNTIKVDNKTYAKTSLFGNWKSKIVFKNHKKYDRNKVKQSDRGYVD